MDPRLERILQSRREFLTTTASGLGGLALTSMLLQEGVLAHADEPLPKVENPLAPKAPHFAPKAKACIFIFMAGAPSQIDLFDPKPKLNELDGQPLPESMTENVRFAFIQKETAVIRGCHRTFTPYGQCGMELSDLLPHIGTCADDIALIRSMHTDAFNHHPGQLMMNTGVMTFGRPVMGAWINYGLGSESQNLPGYVVLSAGRGTTGGASNWSSGFLPSTYQGVLFRNQGDPVLHLSNPANLPHDCQRLGLDAIRDLNQMRYREPQDPEILSRVATYELAGRMQSEAPELFDFSQENADTLEAYGVNRSEGEKWKSLRSGGPDEFQTFASNCLLARRLVERGVRFINIYHATWDHHEDIDNRLPFNCMMCDQPIAALIKDLKQRGLLDSTMVVWGGEFGRTPLGENRAGFRKPNTGRDHHPFAFSMWMAGGGVKGGQVIGKTDDIGWDIVEDPIHVNDLHATMLHLFGIDHERLTYRYQGRDFRLTDVAGKVVNKLLA
ncbi:MAG: DUF1501 domain-containing protein [Candidatus Hydrogenedentes bacterium]|nr:DUF1501 domain-containing protein [Candidatus Hydrogenedentota bacterium]